MVIKSSVLQMEPYISGVQPKRDPGVIKLNTNENPYPPTPNIQQWLQSFALQELRYYPDATSTELRRAIGAVYGVDPRQVFCGNGSDEVLSVLFDICFDVGDTIVTPYPTYTLYKTLADIHQLHCVYVDTDEQFEISIENMIKPSSQGIFIANPNAQTGRLLELSHIEQLLQQYQGVVVIDEAYIDFAEPHTSALPLTAKYPNLVVVRTFSKSYSLCGARVGYCFASADFIAAMDKCKDSYNINVVSQHMARLAVEDQAHFAANVERVNQTRNRLNEGLAQLDYDVFPSNGNFILCRPRRHQAKEIYDYLLQHHIYIRYFPSPRLSDKLRISIGTDDEISVLLERLNHYENTVAAIDK
ncbi:histidinol-phosphate transaminase [Paenibacillus sp. SC116]|uniref:histidinol-phosphate transaminase n=1 Tax=Paenibacillus sp. SC116 TaxID=2968986 RepID=UPI00215A3CBF|nr:histidinol-phosphate transaminase [Paenibacillus sp. SC116]MCR8844264.1 histidinol-phosphate transaminase [Paenibacillus sp. SC116]